MRITRICRTLRYFFYLLVAGVTSYCGIYLFGSLFCKQAGLDKRILVGCIVLGLILGTVESVIIKKGYGFFIIAALLIAFAGTKLMELFGGFAKLFNDVVNAIGYYFTLDLYYVDISEKLMAKANPSMFMGYMLVISSYKFFNDIYTGRKNNTGFIIFISYFLPAILEVERPLWLLFADTLLAVIYIVRANTTKRFGIKKEFANIQAILVCLTVCLAITGLLLIILPSSKYTKPRFFDDINGKLVFSFDDIRNKDWKEVLTPDFDVTGKGVSGGTLGDVSTVGFDHQVMFTVTSSELAGTIYLKAFQANEYSSDKWTPISDSQYKKEKELFEEVNASGFYPQLSSAVNIAENCKPEISTIAALTRNEYIKQDLLVDISVERINKDVYSYVPVTALFVDDKSLADYAKYDKEFLFSGDRNKKKLVHTYKIARPDSVGDLGEVFRRGEANRYRTVSSEDAHEYYQYIAAMEKYSSEFVDKHYLEVNTPARDAIMNNIIPAITHGGVYATDTPYEKGRFVEQVVKYLGGYEYTLSPGRLPEGRDFVDYFLFESKKGYCTYFASAAVMIIRSAGIPARYVEGYVVPERQFVKKGNSYVATVTDENAHAWIEVFVKGIGWVDVEVTKGYTSSSISGDDHEYDSENNTTVNPDEDEYTTPEEDESSKEDDGNGSHNGNKEEDSDDPDGDNTDEESHINIAVKAFLDTLKKILLRALQVFLIILPFIAFIFAILFRKKRVEEARNKIYNEKGGLENKDRVLAILVYFEKMLRYKKIAPRETQTYKEYSTLCPEIIGLDDSRLLEKIIYSEEACSEEDMQKVFMLVKNTRQDIYVSLPWYKKIIFKYILAY